MFASGQHHEGGDFFEVTDLDDLVSTFSDIDFTPAVSIGHYSYKEEAEGYMLTLKRVGNVLFSDIGIIDKDALDKVESKKLNRISLEIDKNVRRQDKVYPYAITGLALLGTSIPAVSGIRTISKFASKESSKIYEYNSEQKKETKKVTTVNHQAKNDIKKTAREIELEEQVLELKAKDREHIDVSKNYEASVGRIKHLEDEARAVKADKLADGCIIPSCKEYVKSLYQALSTGSNTAMKFSIGDEQDLNAEQVLSSLVAQMNKIAPVNFSAKSQHSDIDKQNNSGSKMSAGDELHKKTTELMASSKVDYSTAMSNVLDSDDDLKTRYSK